ncbi:hypothetical protein [Chthonobacter rhizosphaerae]|uniref:hypothetical protein n=1 Tax=Chthonobacter rhizosphaerae TaxID=2735553 RepID=UPI0015EE95DB|nr:hypothetical protein [Chthonobacter rhizosphaerae]
MIRTVAAVVLAAVTLTASPALAVGDPNDPNWPCVQRKVPELTLGALWTGPQFEPGKVDWADDPEVAQMVTTLQQRRVPVPDAVKMIDEYAAGLGEAKSEKLTMLFAGLFERMNLERRDVMNGIVRFAKKQREFATSVRASTAELDKLRNDTSADPMTVQARTDEILTKTRVFEERQKALTFVCEVPVNIEQRLFALGKAITERLN